MPFPRPKGYHEKVRAARIDPLNDRRGAHFIERPKTGPIRTDAPQHASLGIQLLASLDCHAVRPAKKVNCNRLRHPLKSIAASGLTKHLRADRLNLISCEPETGKFYVHPGASEIPVFLAGERVTATTELRRGDRIRIGEAEFEFLS